MRCHGCEQEEAKLYQCSLIGCSTSANAYCEACGEAVHRRKDHKFAEHKTEILVTTTQVDEKESSNNNTTSFSSFSDLFCWNKTQAIKATIEKKPELIPMGLTAAALGGLATVVPPATMVNIAAFGMVATAVTASKKDIIANEASFLSNVRNKLSKKEDADAVALTMFQFQMDDTQNEHIFNENEVNKRYKKFAKLYHPDKKFGDSPTYLRLQVSRQILLYIANPKEHEYPKQWYILFHTDDEIKALNDWNENHNMLAIEHPDAITQPPSDKMESSNTNSDKYFWSWY